MIQSIDRCRAKTHGIVSSIFRKLLDAITVPLCFISSTISGSTASTFDSEYLALVPYYLLFSALGCSIFFEPTDHTLRFWIIGTILSGLGMLLIDMVGSCIILFEVRGLSVLVKMALLACLPLLSGQSQIYLLVLIIVFSTFISHSAKGIRHRNLMPQAIQVKYAFKELPAKEKHHDSWPAISTTHEKNLQPY